MDNVKLKKITLFVLGALAELGSVPEGHLYARLMGEIDLDQFQTVVGVLKSAGWAKSAHYLLTITPAGKVLGDKINAALAGAGK